MYRSGRKNRKPERNPLTEMLDVARNADIADGHNAKQVDAREYAKAGGLNALNNSIGREPKNPIF